jgi:rRNA maturation RNase YbeY
MSIHFSTVNSSFVLDEEKKITDWIKLIIKNTNCRVGEIGYLFCDDEYLLEVNRKYLNHDTYTDIITFDYVSGNLVSGDIMISVDRIRDNAKLFSVPFEQELHRVIIHGIHHLLGQGDKTEEEAAAMRKRENDSLALWETMN